MIWQSWSDFFAMGGYAFYVWWAFIITFGCMACELVALRLRSTSVRRQLIGALRAKKESRQ